jgi:energy-coupling factor transport system permease protein
MFDLYLPRASYLHRLDPRVKLFFVLAAMVTLVAFNHLGVFLAALILIHTLLFAARVPVSRLRWAWGVMLPLTILIPLLWPLFYPAPRDAFFSFFCLRVGPSNLWQGLATALRVDSLAFVFFVLLFTTDQNALVRALVKLGLPFEWGLTLAIALRYIPTFYGLYHQTSEAQQARGLNFAHPSWRTRAGTLQPILIAMLISALRMVENLARALEARGVGVKTARTMWKELHFTRGDALALVLIVAGVGLLLYARLVWGWGATPI